MRSNGQPWPFQPMENIDLAPDYSCPAIDHCSKAWYTAFQQSTDAGKNPVAVRLIANEAYRHAMPPLNSPKNIKDFIACVVHGMMVGAIIDELGNRWIQAARAAAVMHQKAPRKRRSSSRSSPEISAIPESHAKINSPRETV